MQKGRRAKTVAPAVEPDADETRSGRPNPNKDATTRTTHPKGSYGGEGGSPRGEASKTPQKRDK